MATPPTRTPTEILPFLFVGDSSHGTSLEILKEKNISAVMNVSKYDYTSYFKDQPFEYMWIQVDDLPNAPIKDHFEEAINWIHKQRNQNKKVLIHCGEGKSRSVTIILAYLVQIEKFPLLTSIIYVKQRRTIANPNNGFLKQLIEFEKKHSDNGKTTLEKYVKQCDDDWGWGCYAIYQDNGLPFG